MWRKLATPALALLIPALSACGAQVSDSSPRVTVKAVPVANPAPAARPAAPAAPATPLVVFLGDSLTAGLGLDEDQAYPALI